MSNMTSTPQEQLTPPLSAVSAAEPPQPLQINSCQQSYSHHSHPQQSLSNHLYFPATLHAIKHHLTPHIPQTPHNPPQSDHSPHINSLTQPVNPQYLFGRANITHLRPYYVLHVAAREIQPGGQITITLRDFTEDISLSYSPKDVKVPSLGSVIKMVGTNSAHYYRFKFVTLFDPELSTAENITGSNQLNADVLVLISSYIVSWFLHRHFAMARDYYTLFCQPHPISPLSVLVSPLPSSCLRYKEYTSESSYNMNTNQPHLSPYTIIPITTDELFNKVQIRYDHSPIFTSNSTETEQNNSEPEHNIQKKRKAQVYYNGYNITNYLVTSIGTITAHTDCSSCASFNIVSPHNIGKSPKKNHTCIYLTKTDQSDVLVNFHIKPVLNMYSYELLEQQIRYHFEYFDFAQITTDQHHKMMGKSLQRGNNNSHDLIDLDCFTLLVNNDPIIAVLLALYRELISTGQTENDLQNNNLECAADTNPNSNNNNTKTKQRLFSLLPTSKNVSLLSNANIILPAATIHPTPQMPQNIDFTSISLSTPLLRSMLSFIIEQVNESNSTIARYNGLNTKSNNQVTQPNTANPSSHYYPKGMVPLQKGGVISVTQRIAIESFLSSEICDNSKDKEQLQNTRVITTHHCAPLITSYTVLGPSPFIPQPQQMQQKSGQKHNTQYNIDPLIQKYNNYIISTHHHAWLYFLQYLSPSYSHLFPQIMSALSHCSTSEARTQQLQLQCDHLGAVAQQCQLLTMQYRQELYSLRMTVDIMQTEMTSLREQQHSQQKVVQVENENNIDNNISNEPHNPKIIVTLNDSCPPQTPAQQSSIKQTKIPYFPESTPSPVSLTNHHIKTVKITANNTHCQKKDDNGKKQRPRRKNRHYYVNSSSGNLEDIDMNSSCCSSSSSDHEEDDMVDDNIVVVNKKKNQQQQRSYSHAPKRSYSGHQHYAGQLYPPLPHQYPQMIPSLHPTQLYPMQSHFNTPLSTTGATTSQYYIPQQYPHYLYQQQYHHQPHHFAQQYQYENAPIIINAEHYSPQHAPISPQPYTSNAVPPQVQQPLLYPHLSPHHHQNTLATEDALSSARSINAPSSSSSSSSFQSNRIQVLNDDDVTESASITSLSSARSMISLISSADSKYNNQQSYNTQQQKGKNHNYQNTKSKK